ncbi:MAG: hypothetical protein B6D41_09965 [Chloroflexi bacterium UTCFX4]|nr:MAG: hypothetical protein B6D41_09965 [Chloroflexi bacterium UTCFX4]
MSRRNYYWRWQNKENHFSSKSFWTRINAELRGKEFWFKPRSSASEKVTARVLSRRSCYWKWLHKENHFSSKSFWTRINAELRGKFFFTGVYPRKSASKKVTARVSSRPNCW